MHNELMANDSAVTVRIPASLKRRLDARARDGHRSLSAQVLHDLSTATDAASPGPAPGRFVGLFAGARVPSDPDVREVRADLWRRLSPSTRG